MNKNILSLSQQLNGVQYLANKCEYEAINEVISEAVSSQGYEMALPPTALIILYSNHVNTQHKWDIDNMIL